MTTLFVAAGGGGDAVGILLARRVLDPDGEGPALITTCAWERLRIDPVPGPRPISGFNGLGYVDGLAVEVLESSDTIPGGLSMLPHLSAEADARIFLHDFEGGTLGLVQQLRNTASAVFADRLMVVDVGGDVIGTGQEANLLSPLADSLTLAAALSSGIPTSLAVIGPGTDAELTEEAVIERLKHLGAKAPGHVTPADVQRCEQVLSWHPTEASGLVASSALGERGAVEMRRGQRPTPLTEHGRDVLLVERPRLEDFPLAIALAPTASLPESLEVIERMAVNEIAYETDRAAHLRARGRRAPVPIQQIAETARKNGATHITTRRLVEQADLTLPPDDASLRQFELYARRVGGLWELAP